MRFLKVFKSGSFTTNFYSPGQDNRLEIKVHATRLDGPGRLALRPVERAHQNGLSTKLRRVV